MIICKNESGNACILAAFKRGENKKFQSLCMEILMPLRIPLSYTSIEKVQGNEIFKLELPSSLVEIKDVEKIKERLEELAKRKGCTEL